MSWQRKALFILLLPVLAFAGEVTPGGPAVISRAGGSSTATGVLAPAGQSATIMGQAPDTLNQVGVIVDNTPALTASGTLSLSIRTGGVQVARVSSAGILTATGLNLAADGQSICLNGAASRCIRWVTSTYDFGGTAPIVSGSYIAEVGSGSNGLRFTTAGVRMKLSLAGTLDYLDSDGTRTRVGGGTGELSVGVIRIDRTDSTGTPGNVTINKMSGKVAIAVGAAAVTVTNSVAVAAAGCLVTLNTVDATLTQILSCVPGPGSIVITGNANATAATNVTFLLTP